MPLVLPGLLLGFGVVAGFLVLYGLSQTSQTLTGSKAETEQGGIVGWLKTITGLSIGGQILGLANKAVRTTISHWAEAHLRGMAAWFSGLSTLSLHLFQSIGDLAVATEQAVAHLAGVTIPREARKAVAPVKAVAHGAAHTAAHGLSAARAAEAEAERLFGKARKGIDYLTRQVERTIPRALDRVRSRVGTLEREIPAGLRGRLKTLEKAVAFASIAGVVLKVLARRFPWLFCRKVKAANTLLCGLDEDLFQSLLTDALLIGGTLSLVEFAREMVDVTEQAVRPIASFWQAD